MIRLHLAPDMSAGLPVVSSTACTKQLLKTRTGTVSFLGQELSGELRKMF